ncbi:GH92 family glycosyl hydrolase [Dysgonomonas termitidis]|uniref:GH92 family glycosyl hydrolase n=1 Tax=Dysgonomonas termitidis TaxID=1516126 RepID=A0ABV9KUP3_9BACT
MSGIVSAQDKVSFVNPMIGTVKMGHTFPGACVPHGIVQLSPDTDTIPHSINGVYQKDTYKYCAGYQHDDKTIVGFSHTHLSGTGHSDLGDILVVPVTGELKFNPGVAGIPRSGYRSSYSHDTEVSRPGYYEVVLDDYKVKAQLTATERVGVHKYTYPENEEQKILLDLVHGIYNYDGKVLWASLRVENDTLITGYRITNGWSRENYTYFAISLSKPIKNYGYVDREKPKYTGFWRKFNLYKNFPEIAGRKIVAHFEFGSDNSPLVMKVALSAVSTEGALKNLKAEAAAKSFDKIVAEASAKWEKELDVIDVNGDADKKTMFYTSLYHTMINPSVYQDVDGQYRGIDHNIHQAKGFTNYTIFSVWDTYRALHPLFNIINRERSVDIVNSMIAHYEQSVHKALPVWSHMGNENWCMIGYHSVSVLADAIDKGLNIDKKKALEAMISSSNVDYYDGTGEYKKLGYVPFDKNGSGSSITLEYSYDDWTIYNTALKVDNQAATDTYKKRALNYHNVFDPELEFVRARYSDGRWKTPFNLLSTHGEGFIEGNSWNYSFYVPHDVKGLIKQMGGDKQFVQRLDSLFIMHLPDEFFADTEDVTREGVMGNYVHGNEPSHHIAYLYAWTSQPWRTQYWVREIMNRMYRNSIDGLCGNDDCGQMSAWYIFSAMGFYPVCPGSNEYVFGAPYFPYMKVKVGDGKYLEIKADKVSDKMRYVKSVKLNGKPYTKAYITYDDIKNGAELTFEMAAAPNKKRTFSEEEKPYSLSKQTI